MISEALQGKTVAILGYESLIGKILIRKLLQLLGDSLASITLITQSCKPEQALVDQLFGKDRFFSTVDHGRAKMIKFVGPGLNTITTDIDVMYNCLLPQDPTRVSMETSIQKHIVVSQFICSELLESMLRGKVIKKMLIVSSLYCENPGFISESVNSDIEKAHISSWNQVQSLLPSATKQSEKRTQPNFSKLLEHLTEIYRSDHEIWQWSVQFMQMLYASQKNVQFLEIIRIPVMGPTLNGYEGYTENFNSLTRLLYEIGNDFLHHLEGAPNNIIDMIPVDYVVNYMITVSALELPNLLSTSTVQIKTTNDIDENSSEMSTKMSVHNLSTSSRNPIHLSQFANYIIQAWAEYSANKINFCIRDKKWQINLSSIKTNLPQQAKKRMATLFDLKSWKIQHQQFEVHERKKKDTIKKYRYYFEKQWICESNKSIDYFAMMVKEDQNNYHFNVNSINWKTYAKLCCYSIKKYLLGVDIEQFNPSNLDLLSLQRSSYFSDIVWAVTQGKSVPTQSLQDIKNYILSAKSVKQAVKTLVEEQTKKLEQTPMAYQTIEKQYLGVADQMCNQMFSQYSMNSIRSFAWFLHKVFRTIYEKVVIDKNSIIKLQHHDEQKNGPLIIIPTHRSYIDFLIMSYVFFGYGIKCPHIAAAEDFLNMAVVHVLLRKSGAFFIKRNQKTNKVLYKAIMTEYISKLLTQNHYLEFFVEGTRSRAGKMLSPKYGILSIVAKNVLEARIPDAQILPATINYEKVLESQSFTYQMMGESKVKQSLSRLIKAANVLKEDYGRIYIEFCEPISVSKYFQENSWKYESRKEAQVESVLNQMGYTIVHEMTKSIVVTGPAILSAIILMNRIGISDDRLSEKTHWLCKQISRRGIKITRTQADSSISISDTLALMENIVNKSKKDMFEVQVTFDQNSFVQLFTLAYYRNTLTHIFFEEAVICVAVAGFGHPAIKSASIAVEQVVGWSGFLAKLLSRQFVLQNFLQDEARVRNVLESMASRGVLIISNDTNTMGLNPESDFFNFCCSLVWPIIESYWITCLYLFKLLKDNLVLETAKLQSQIQWFGQSLFTERVILHLQAISTDNIKNSIATMISNKVITDVFEAEKPGVKVIGGQKLKQLEDKISRHLKSRYAESVKGLVGTGRGTVALDFPFLSKL